MRRVVGAAIAAAVLGAGIAGCGSSADSGPPTGESLYLRQCSACHGGSATGASAPALVGDDATPRSDDELVTIIAEGVNSMPAFGDRLSAEEINMVVDHLRTLETE